MKQRGLFFTLTLLFSAQFIVAADWIMNESDNWTENSWFGNINYLESAQAYEKDNEFEDAADAYEMVFRLASNPENKAHALFKKAEILQDGGLNYQAYKAYTELINRYPSKKFFVPALNNMFLLAQTYESKREELFTANKEKALEIYQTIIDTAPFSDNAAEILLRMAKLRAGSFYSELGITNYETLIKSYKNFPKENSAAYLNLAHIYNNMAIDHDSDCELTQKAIHLVDTFLHKFPTNNRIGEAKQLKSTLRNRMGEYYFTLGKFYTWEANYSRKASQRYLHKVLFDYNETPAAGKAELLLASVDPNSKEIIAQANGKVAQTPSKQSIKLEPFTKSQDSGKWTKQQPLPTDQQDSDKWLLPVPNIKGDVK